MVGSDNENSWQSNNSVWCGGKVINKNASFQFSFLTLIFTSFLDVLIVINEETQLQTN
jgi:hypothetical protein